ncbi:hypothetical protein [Polymorphospora lycopeni]|uniref:Uncharacterized protein n=1 Tax=Polymorphospora lycopeni TaxID=3140240 RepID=A0ABV5CLQ8_9ACTN
MTDNLPEDDGYDLIYPFTVCASNGGPYDDEAFTAGMQAGRVDHALAAAAAVGITEATFTVSTPLVPQLDLIGMHRGFSTMEAKDAEVDGWSFVRFSMPLPTS